MEKVRCFFLTALFVLRMTGVAGASEFSTWEGFETDKLASIWLIQRFVSPGADIVLYPKGKNPDKGVQFDTPYSKISRRFNQSTFESLIDYYRIDDPKLKAIGKLIHDIEINVWEKKMYQKTMEMDLFFMDLLSDSLEDTVILHRSSKYFDRLYDELTDELELN